MLFRSAKYGATVDRQSAYEIVTARIQAARAAAATAAANAAYGARVPATTAGGLNTMTPARQARVIARGEREMAAAQRALDRAAQRARAAQERQARANARANQRMVETGIRTAGRVLTFRSGQNLMRGIFGTLFGGGRR